ncbi:MAG: hypothetical protein LC791_04255 [Acidobacteria bacterium]|nr:hypothetical protein [Acidobacteriota bacterium]
MAQHDADSEYGPTPADAHYEHTDIEPSVAWKFAIWLVAGMIISAAIVYASFWFFERQEQAADREAQTFPLAVGQVRQAPTPRLQTQPFKDLYLLRQHETEQLSSYGWVDQATGIVRLPIDRAMERVLEQLPVRPQPSSTTVDELVMDSSAGRTTARR